MVAEKKPAEDGSASGGKTQTLVLLDAHAIIHRAYHALPDFTSSSGEPTGALYGVSSMLLKIIKELKPDIVIACYDLQKPTFRHEAYKEYKGKRAKTDDALVAQIPRSRDIFKAFNIPIFEKEGFEADDIIGTIASVAKKDASTRVIIASGDMDTLQLVDDKKVQVYTLKKGITDTVIYDEKAVIERYGFGPKLIPDYKGLRGDPSDNIIGIAGIGEKTATLLIQKFGNLEKIYKALKKDPQAFEKAGFKERIIKLLKDGEEDALFSKVLAQIRLDAPINFKIPPNHWIDTLDTGKITELFSNLGFRSLVARITDTFPQKGLLKEEKKDEPQEKVSSDDLEKTAIALWLIDSNITNPSLEDIVNYARVKSFQKAKEFIFKKLNEDKLESVYNNIELPLIPILKKMEERGILIDTVYINKLSKEYHVELTALEKEIYKFAGEEFNINSPKQLGEVLFGKMNIAKGKLKKTKGGANSTRASELEKLKDAHPIVEKLLAYREFQKLLSTYIDNIPDMLDGNNRLHTHFVQTGTTTGRFASQNPNLQNIPIRTELGKNIRNAFIADKGYKLVAFDYSQIELRVAAILSGDKKLKKIFIDGHDVHSATAAEVFSVPLLKVTSDMRRMAKIINFGVIYGMGVNAVRQNIGCTREEAQKFYTNYFGTFKTLADFLEETKEIARKRGYTETLFGRRRYFHGLRSNLPHIVAMEERMAQNAPIQGTNADITKLAMTRVEKRLEKEGLLEDANVLLTIHDELLYEIKEDVVEMAAPIIAEEMESILKKDISFVVSVSVGYNWGEMKKLSIK